MKSFSFKTTHSVNLSWAILWTYFVEWSLEPTVFLSVLLMSVVAGILSFRNLQLFVVFARPFLCTVQMCCSGFCFFCAPSRI